MNKLFFTAVLFYNLFSIGCTYDTEAVTPKVPSGIDCDFDIGEYLLLPSNRIFLPYDGKSSITFQDSIGQSIEFRISESPLFRGVTYLSKFGVHEPGDTIRYCYRFEHKTYTLKNDSLGTFFNLRIAACPYDADPLKEYISDKLDLGYYRWDTNLIFWRNVFCKTIDQRTFPEINDNLENFPSLLILGREFQNVERSKNPVHLNEIFFNTTEGLVSFRDFSNKKWRFESVQ